MRPLIYYTVVRHIFIPAATLVAEKSKPASNEHVCKPSELPIYTTDVVKVQKVEPCPPQEPGTLEQTFRYLRKGLFAMMHEIKNVEQLGEDYYNVVIENGQFAINYLQEEENVLPKYGAIALGGLAGLILGLRGRMFKRTFYTTVGALGMAAICYPKQASQYSHVAGVEVTRYATIGYNFISGGEDSCGAAELVANKQVIDEHLIDPLEIVAEAHDDAINNSCHCPVGACMGQHVESPPPVLEPLPPDDDE